ncbi:MAG: hypothetical protein LBD13_02940 [Spirochaetaceae bacterium]|nr:hypothetical protein [Spirochaetaceae bacterium]
MFITTKTFLSLHKPLFYNGLSALYASLGRIWGLFYRRFMGSRILFRTSRKGTAFGCPQTPNQCDVCSARAPSTSAEAPLRGCD